MDPKVVDIRRGARRETPVPDFWFAQVDLRLGQIEAVIRRLERMLWVVVAGSAALMIFEIVKALSGRGL